MRIGLLVTYHCCSVLRCSGCVVYVGAKLRGWARYFATPFSVKYRGNKNEMNASIALYTFLCTRNGSSSRHKFSPFQFFLEFLCLVQTFQDLLSHKRFF